MNYFQAMGHNMARRIIQKPSTWAYAGLTTLFELGGLYSCMAGKV